MNLKSTIKKIINYAVQVSEPEKIILFGSMANGVANAFSDIDLLIISDIQMDKMEAISRIQNFAREYGLKSDVLMRSPEELANEICIPNSFVKAIEKTGVIMYKKKP